MRLIRILPLLAAFGLSNLAHADAPSAGSVLIFPIHDSRDVITVLNVTNTNVSSNGDVRAVYQYVNTVPDPDKPLKPLHCNVFYRSETLTPADMVSVVTHCHNATAPQQGYVVVSAKAMSGLTASHNHLVGSQLVVNPAGSVYSMLPFSFEAIGPDGTPTDVDQDGRLDFDGVEYEALPNELIIDSFAPVANTRLVLFSMSGGLDYDTVVRMNITNDNEFPLSLTFTFRCWFEIPLSELSSIFTENFLMGTADDPGEMDVNCDQVGDFETGWVRMTGLTASNGFETISNPAILGGLTAGPLELEGGRLLWGKGANTKGEF